CRDAGPTRDIVGCMVNNVVFRTRIDGAASFRELLRQERDTALAAFGNSAVPFERVVETMAPRRRFGVHPLFQVLFLFDAGREEAIRGGDLQFGLTTWAAPRGSYWDLELSMVDGGAGEAIRGYFGYAECLFDAAVAGALPANLARWLRVLVETPDAPVARLPMLDADASRRALRELNATVEPYPEQQTLHGLFEAQVSRTPHRAALIASDGERSLSYRELDRRANLLAAELQGRGIHRGDLVGIGAERSPELVIAILATLKAGAAYVPLDPAYPAARLEFIARDTGIELLLSTGASKAAFDSGTQVLRLDRFDWDAAAPDASHVASQPGDAAYVLYTSGSTGQPKGAIGQHRGAVNRCAWMWREYAFTSDDCFAMRTSPNFVDSVWEIFGPLAHGAAVRVLPDDIVRDPARLIDVLASEMATPTHIVVVPSLLTAMLDAEPDLGRRLPALKTWITSGEPLTPALLRRFRGAAPNATLLNTYGTSEIWDATCYDTREWDGDGTRIPIGRPIANVSAFILDRGMNPVPAGVVGELCVGGVGVGSGYWQRPELTAEKFVRSPVEMDSTLYRTGDLARRLPDGNIECLGRIDGQVKLRGFRIEFGEIESALADCPAIERAAVDVRPDAGGQPMLVAWAVARAAAGAAGDFRVGVIASLRSRLPDFMVPSAIVSIEDLPQTPSGKIDRRALPDPGPGDSRLEGGKVSHVEPQGDTEIRVARIWVEVIGSRRAGRHDDFFASGGHSLSAAKLLARLRAEFDVDIGLRHLFDRPTVGALAAEIDRMRRFADIPAQSAVARIDRNAAIPLSFGQERLWFLNQLDPASPAYNIAFTVEIAGDVDAAAMQTAVDRLVERHESLRTVFPAQGGKPSQRILASADARVTLVERQHIGQDQESLNASLWHIVALPFELERGPLLRVYLQHWAERRSRLIIVVHHIVSDGVSNGILFSELADFYAAASRGSQAHREELGIQYAEYAAWQREPERDRDLERSMRYWVERLSGAPPALELATDRPRSAEQRFRGGWVWRRVDGERTDAMRSLGRDNGCTLFMVMLGAFDVLLHRYSGQTDLLVGTPVAGRERVEFESLIGLFINTVVLRVDVDGDPRFVELLDRVRNATLDAQEHQRLPFEKLVEALRPDRTLSHAPIFQVMFNMTPIPDRKADVGGVEFSMGRLLDHGVSTFDLTLSIGERADGLELVYEYDSDLFDRETIEQFAAHYDNLLDAIVAEPDRNLSRLPVMGAAEIRALTGPRRVTGVTRESTLARFERHAAKLPSACAVVDGALRLSYGDLDARANRLAHELLEHGIGPGHRIAVCLERSADALTAILAIHKCGCAYVPIDPDQPAQRVADMLRQAEPHAAVTRSRFAALFADAGSVNLVQLDLDADSLAARPAVRPDIATRPDAHAYVLFTSGSTGRPKGIAIT
ncbi:MAG: amino acid adenylation domain-containing protein, partial [Gammaproteobacteria bacterium]|nr:amino acid adenylation domain-containing protein [Gammaproteobacteria bacterium]